ncbi:MAG TPA: SDR family NAD(P)-dependent oxidoreductase [Usitatibacter sp.]|jgi:3-oxoacyl-[acyl-carrier protein] reductase|nr:SDR family NAD(P)-dependent oxidoreductase [Usitatibacter sp.]
MPLAGKTAVVTGAAGTLGLAAARALLEQHAHVALVDQDALRLDNLSRFLRGTVMAIASDVTDPAAVREAIGRIEGTAGPIDILVNAASIASTERSDALTEVEWRRILAVNVEGAFSWSRAVLPGMKRRGWGRIVNVGSVAAKAPLGDAGPAYTVSKAALEALTFALAREAAPHGVTVNAVAPAFVKSRELEEMHEAQRRQLLALVPVGRFCEPEEFGHAVAFLVSPLAGFVTGEVLDVNGGLHMD